MSYLMPRGHKYEGRRSRPSVQELVPAAYCKVSLACSQVHKDSARTMR